MKDLGKNDLTRETILSTGLHDTIRRAPRHSKVETNFYLLQLLAVEVISKATETIFVTTLRQSVTYKLTSD